MNVFVQSKRVLLGSVFLVGWILIDREVSVPGRQVEKVQASASLILSMPALGFWVSISTDQILVGAATIASPDVMNENRKT